MVVLEDTSPNGNIQAVVEQDERVAYFTLYPDDETGEPIKSCWVRNLVPAPARVDVEALHLGRPALMPRGACAHPDGVEPLEPDNLRILWLEEGDGAALIDASLPDDEVLAFIPGFAGVDGFPGYARDSLAEHALAWPLDDERDDVWARIDEAAEYWESWQDTTTWPVLQDRLMDAYERVFGEHERYYAIDGEMWPPRALIRVATDDAWVLLTLGVSIRRQPKVELAPEGADASARVEFAMALERDVDELTLRRAMTYLSAQSSYPWTRYLWLGDGHTTSCDAFPQVGTSPGFPAALLTRTPLGAPAVAMPDYRGPVDLLWLLPITDAERAYAIAEGSPALERRLERAGPTWIHRSERPTL